MTPENLLKQKFDNFVLWLTPLLNNEITSKPEFKLLEQAKKEPAMILFLMIKQMLEPVAPLIVLKDLNLFDSLFGALSGLSIKNNLSDTDYHKLWRYLECFGELTGVTSGIRVTQIDPTTLKSKEQ